MAWRAASVTAETLSWAIGAAFVFLTAGSFLATFVPLAWAPVLCLGSTALWGVVALPRLLRKRAPHLTPFSGAELATPPALMGASYAVWALSTHRYLPQWMVGVYMALVLWVALVVAYALLRTWHNFLRQPG
jgi:hypothetical protein